MATVQSEVITSGKYGTGPTILISIYKRQALGGEVKRVQGYLFNSSEGLQRSFKEKKVKLKHIGQLFFTSMCTDRYLGLSGGILRYLVVSGGCFRIFGGCHFGYS